MSKRTYDSIVVEDVTCSRMDSLYDSDDDVFDRVNPQLVNDLQQICLTDSHTKDISKMYLNPQYSDCVLRVGEEEVPVNRSLLSVRCPYFETLFFGPMYESGKSVIELFGIKVEPFKHVLKFLYSGTFNLNSLSIEAIIEILEVSQYCCLEEFVNRVVNYLKISLTLSNVFFIQSAAKLYSIPDLIRTTNLFIDQNANQIIKSELYLTLSYEELVKMINKDSFYVECEENILKSVCLWFQKNSEQLSGQEIEELFDCVRFWQINKDKAKNIFESNVNMPSNSMIEMIEKKIKKKPKLVDRKCRGLVKLNQNLASTQFDVKVIKGRKKNRMVTEWTRYYGRNHACTSHTIGNTANSFIIVQLSKVFYINHIFMILYDIGLRTYSYQVEVSVDRKTWHQVVDHRSYLCRSNQYLFFEPQPVKYIRIQGTDSMTLYPLVRYLEFDVLRFECMYSTVCPQTHMGFIKPKNNVFNNEFHPKPINEKRSIDLKQNYEAKEEVGGRVARVESIPLHKGSYYWFLDKCAYVHFSQPFFINTIAVVFDRTKEYTQSFTFCIEVSLNNILWKRVCDTKEIKDGLSRTELRFSEELALFVRVSSSENWTTDNLKAIECYFSESSDRSFFVKKAKTSVF